MDEAGRNLRTLVSPEASLHLTSWKSYCRLLIESVSPGTSAQLWFVEHLRGFVFISAKKISLSASNECGTFDTSR